MVFLTRRWSDSPVTHPCPTPCTEGIMGGFHSSRFMLHTLLLSGSDPMENQVLAGLVQSGTAGFVPLGGAAVTLYRATEHSPVAIGHATADAEGRFSIPVAE